MANICEPNPEELEQWLQGRPQIIKDTCTRFPPYKLYAHNLGSGVVQRVYIESYYEDGRVRIGVTGEFNLLSFARGVIIDPKSLTECDLPREDECVGAIFETDEEVDLFIEFYKKYSNPFSDASLNKISIMEQLQSNQLLLSSGIKDSSGAEIIISYQEHPDFVIIEDASLRTYDPKFLPIIKTFGFQLKSDKSLRGIVSDVYNNPIKFTIRETLKIIKLIFLIVYLDHKCNE